MKRFNAELRAILDPVLWLGCRDRNQKTDAIPILHLVRDWKVAAALNRSNDVERPAEQWMSGIAYHNYFEDG